MEREARSIVDHVFPHGMSAEKPCRDCRRRKCGSPSNVGYGTARESEAIYLERDVAAIVQALFAKPLLRAEGLEVSNVHTSPRRKRAAGCGPHSRQIRWSGPGLYYFWRNAKAQLPAAEASAFVRRGALSGKPETIPWR